MAPLLYTAQCSSTQQEILQFLKDNPTGPLALFTLDQTGGRGQYGKVWEMPANRNIAYTLAIAEKECEIQAVLFNFRTAALVADFVANLTKQALEIKWPNDIILNQKKIAGLLTERVTVEGQPYYLIGIGLNVLQREFPGLPKAGSLLSQTGHSYDPKQVAEDLHAFLTAHITGNISAPDIIKNINDRLFGKGKVMVFDTKSGRQNGIIREMDSNGLLLVDLEREGEQKFRNQEITMLY